MTFETTYTICDLCGCQVLVTYPHNGLDICKSCFDLCEDQEAERLHFGEITE